MAEIISIAKTGTGLLAPDIGLVSSLLCIDNDQETFLGQPMPNSGAACQAERVIVSFLAEIARQIEAVITQNAPLFS